MGLFDWLKGRSHASASWQKEEGFDIQLDLDRHAVCRCSIGDPVSLLSGLGPPEDSRALSEERYCYYSRGLEVRTEEGNVADFGVFWIDYLHQGFRPFDAPIYFRGSRIRLNAASTEQDFVESFGTPYWRDQDDEEAILFYEFRSDIEWQVEFTLEGRLKALMVVWPAIMADSEQRERYGVTSPWPPPRR